MTRELEVWKEQGRALKAAEVRLRKTEFTHQWAIADWMLAGEKAFKMKRAYDEAVKVTGMTRETLQQFAHTAKKVLIRVKGLSFSHHRLVAKLSPDRQKEELKYAKKRGLTVADFDLYLKGFAHDDERQKNTPTNADAGAVKFMKRCDELLSHWGLQAVLSGAPPVAERRDELVSKLEETARRLNEIVEELRHNWQLYLPLQPTVGFTRKEDYEKWLQNAEWRRRESAENKSDVPGAGGGQ